MAIRFMHAHITVRIGSDQPAARPGGLKTMLPPVFVLDPMARLS
jgi:hypothetical protein